MQNVTLTIAGLHTNPSDLSEVPPGALKTANNIDIDRPSIATPRKGFSRFGDEFSNPAARVGSVFFFDGKVLVRRSDNVLMYWDGNDWQAYSGTFAEPSSGVPVRAVPGGKSLFFSTAAGVRKLTSATGSLNPAGLKAPIAVTKGVLSHSGPSMNPSTRIAYRFTVAKKDEHGVISESPPSDRIVLSNWYSGSYKPRVTLIFNNSGDLYLRLYASPELDISTTAAEPSDEMTLVWEYLWTGMNAYGDINIEPSHYIDRAPGLALYTNSTQQGIAASNEEPPRARDIAVFNGYTFYLAPKFKQRLLLTLNSGDTSGLWAGLTLGKKLTIGSMNLTAAIDASYATSATTRDFRYVTWGTSNYALFALNQATGVNTSTEELTFTDHGLQTNDQVMVTSSGTLPTGLVANTLYFVIRVDANKFKLSETYGGSAKDIIAIGSGFLSVWLRQVEGIAPTHPDTREAFVEVTAKSLVAAINYPQAAAPSPYYARYLSGADDVPGQILIEARDVDAAAFTVSSDATNANTWTPDLYSGKTATSSDDYAPNKLAWSKQFQTDSVPLTNVHPGIGSARAEALRILPTRDSLFILKEDGVYRLTGTTAETFSIEDFDTSIQVIAPKAACVLDNMIFCLTSDGPAIVSDLGVDKTFGNPILKELKDLRGRTSAKVAHFNANTWAVAHDKRFILSVGYLDDSSNPQTKLYVFNTRTKTWVTWSKKLTCAETSPVDGLLYAGSADYAYLLCQDRTTHDDTDTGSTVGIDSEIEWVVKSLAGPAASSQFSEVKVIMIDDFPASASLITSTDTNSTPITQTITTHAVGSGRRPHRQSVPRNHQRGTLLNVKVRHNAAGYYEIAGISVEGSAVSTRTQK